MKNPKLTTELSDAAKSLSDFSMELALNGISGELLHEIVVAATPVIVEHHLPYNTEEDENVYG